ncbi:hypothetical protein CHUAL_002220 [Chamberlinius hualienensis]
MEELISDQLAAALWSIRYYADVYGLLLVVVLALQSSESNCNLERLEICQAPLRQLLADNEYIIAVNKTQLLKVCKRITPVVECADDFLSKCITANTIEIEKMFLGFRTFLNNVCDENSQISKDYLTHAPCMTKAEDQIHNCMNNSQLDIENSSSSDEYTFDNICCVMKRLLLCTREVYKDYCGEDAATIGQQTLITMLGPTIQKVCKDEYLDLRCSGSVHLIESTASIFIFISIIFTLKLVNQL